MKFLSLTLFALLALRASAPGQAQAPPQAPPAPEPARIQPQDHLYYLVREDPSHPKEPEEVVVGPQGRAQFRVGAGFDEVVTVEAAGKTVDELAAELQRKLTENFYEQANVVLKLKEAGGRAGRVLFFGAVRGNILTLQPGEIKPIFEGVYQVGVTEFANLKKVKLNRFDPATRQTRSWIINLDEIRKGNRAQDMPLCDGDRVEVPERSLVF
jgi:hypothetical protein